MDLFETSHLGRQALRQELKAWDGKDRVTAAVLLSRIAEFDALEIYLEDGYPSMYSYCLQELHYCEGTASRRIYAARTARRFPLIFSALAEGKVHLTAVLMLSRYLTEANVGELVHAATHMSKERVAQLIAERFPRRDLPERREAIVPASAMPPFLAQAARHSPENVGAGTIFTPPVGREPVPQHSPENVGAGIDPPVPQHSPENVASPEPRSRKTPLAPERYGFQFTGDQETNQLYDDVRALLSHQVPNGEMAQVFKRALQLAKAELMKRKYAVTDRPGRSRGSKSARHISAETRRQVHERDEGRCAFVSESGKRCDSRHMVEFDHAAPRACGGESTPENLRLLCRAHNQVVAERAFGAGFMERKRAESRARTVASRSGRGGSNCRTKPA
jgi:5-methylcytosine-specific restriction endonuclease McrA